MKVTVLLADAAQAVDGKLYILGGGWSITSGPAPSAIAMKLEIPWDQTNVAHHWELYLLDADGQPVMVPTPEGDQPVEARGDFEVGRPAGLPPGTPIDLPLAISIGPLPLGASGRYTWRLTVDGQTDEDWSVTFSTVAPQPA